MEDPKKMIERVTIPDKDKQNIETLVFQYPELKDLEEELKELFLNHERSLVHIMLVDNPEFWIYEHQMLLEGLIIKSRGLLGATIREVLQSNKSAVSPLLRTQCESLATICYLEKFPEKVHQVLFGSRDGGTSVVAINIITMMEHADQKYNGLLKDYNDLSELSHPNARSHFSVHKIVDEEQRKIETWSSGTFEKEDAILSIRLAYFWTKWLLETSVEFHDLIWSEMKKAKNVGKAS